MSNPLPPRSTRLVNPLYHSPSLLYHPFFLYCYALLLSHHPFLLYCYAFPLLYCYAFPLWGRLPTQCRLLCGTKGNRAESPHFLLDFFAAAGYSLLDGTVNFDTTSLVLLCYKLLNQLEFRA